MKKGLSLMILSDNLITKETTENDTWNDISNKLDEEYYNFKKSVWADNKLKKAYVALDIMQLSIRMLTLLAKEGFSIRQLFNRHNKKLVNQGWREKKIIEIFIKG